jgi:uncharacterized RmlC-like cupin family protein
MKSSAITFTLVALLIFFVGAKVASTAEPTTKAPSAPPPYGQVVLVSSPAEIATAQKLPNFVGISAKTVGAKGLSMNIVVIPPGGRAEPHSHQGFESAVYVLSGRVDTRWGEHLENSTIAEAGQFLFIPPGVPHQPINLSATEPARAIVVRNDPNEQEHVLLHNAVKKEP